MSNDARAAIFLDRDGTIIEDRGYLRNPADAVFLPGTSEALKRLQEYFLLFIVTNQTGVAKGAITLADVDQVNRRVVATLAEHGVAIGDVYVCPHGREDDCRCMKPKPHFVKRAAELYGINLSESFVVGDHPHDVELAENSGARGIYVLTGHGQKHRDELPAETVIASGMTEVAETILSHRLDSNVCKPKRTNEEQLTRISAA